MIRTLPLIVALVISPATKVLGDSEQCADNVLAMMQKDNNALYHHTVSMMKAYNETCRDDNLCEYQLSENTLAFLAAAQTAEGAPGLPDFPVVATVDADFAGFFDHAELDEYKSSCTKEGGGITPIDFDLRMKGTAMDLVDIDLELKMDNFPMCFPGGCENEDLEKAFEAAVKDVFLKAMMDDITPAQTAVLKTMDIGTACAAAGIELCTLDVQESGKSAVPKGAVNRDVSGGVLVLNRKFIYLFVSVSFLLANIN